MPTTKTSHAEQTESLYQTAAKRPSPSPFSYTLIMQLYITETYS